MRFPTSCLFIAAIAGAATSPLANAEAKPAGLDSQDIHATASAIGGEVIGERIFLHLEARAALPKFPIMNQPDEEHRLVVKFHDHIEARARDGRVESLAGVRLPDLDALKAARSDIRFRQLIDLPDAAIGRVEADAAARTGIRPADLRGMHIVEAPVEQLTEIAEALNAMDTVEWVDFEVLRPEPPCFDIAPVSADPTFQQGYRGPHPGVNMLATQELPFSRGEGIAIADIEYGFNANHEDLCNVALEPGTAIPSWVINNGWDSHGTAVLGILNAPDNGYGVTGLALDADAYFFPEWIEPAGSRRAAAITNAAATLNPGDIVVLEMQTTILGGQLYGPAELDFSVWNATRTAVDAGLVVIGAAGNGDQDLDSPSYNSYMARGDSGAIIVGAGSATTAHSKLWYSTHGSRVDVQGWGEQVATTGYGNWITYAGDKEQRYTSSFSGTSSATPLVSGVAASVQSYVKSTYGQILTSEQMRTLLIDTGIPQTGSGGNIGPFPDALAARNAAPATLGIIDDFAPVSPADGATVDGPSVTIEWEAISSPSVMYVISVADNPSFSPSLIDSAFTPNTELDLSAITLDPGTTYFWAVEAMTSSGGVTMTPAIASFTIADACPGDTNGDGAVTPTDISIVLGNFGSNAATGPADGDLNSDGIVNALDISAVLDAFGSICN